MEDFCQQILEVSIGTRLKALRLKAGLTQVQLAKAAGTIQSAVTHYENDNKVPSAPKLAAIAKALGTSVEEILGDTPLPETQARPLIHGNSLAAKIQDVFLQLRTEDQKALYHHAEGLLQRRKIPTPKRRRNAA